ncbi:MAG TPA: arylsulfatase [Rhodopirellula baltica]|uniref:Arylsulfatase A [precursor] n=1 Tax=Rhodopirellula baltica (strain DSM 10527 / NCIMB 13988 / SH1) TaxID=243090 RepID=Q7UG72_RHOBA|nr:sulfatase [Rhodopirellula baltica]CAD78457.1 arylsulfatase A [precursor] [Rhodopirellula baltica SH 1]HBE62013.1 arylsulfatase [Rhodopirellula baltica]
MRLPHLLALCLPAFFTALPASATAPEDIAGSRPNIVVIYMDDMAYADIGPFGAKGYSTPNLDRMANEGRKFTDFSVSSAVCSASRSALLTGCYHRRVGLSGALGPQAKIGLAPAETTFAEVCKSAGYRTACHGKWHLGHHPKFLPTNQGFDQFYGIPYSNDMWPLHPDTIRRQQKDPNDPGNWPPLPIIESIAGQPPRIVNDNVQPADQEQMTVELTRRSVEFIKNQSSDKPFLLYLPHPMVHVPLYVSERFRGKSGAGLFGDVMMEVDWSVGEILSAIESIDQQKNTLVIFTSDNGPWLSYGNHAGSAAPLREGKGTQWEGGVREPTLMWWPETIPAGTTCETFCSTIDVLPTIVELTGGEAPERKIDGHSIVDLMLDVPGAKSPHESFVGYYGGGQLQTIRNERFKLVFPHAYRTLGDREPGKDGMPDGYAMTKSGLELYDLDADVSETTNVIEAHPEVVKQLQAAAEVYRQQLGDKLQKVKGSEIRGPGKLNENEPQLSW